MLDGHNIFFPPVSSTSFLAAETPSSELEQGREGRHTRGTGALATLVAVSYFTTV